MTNLTPAQLEQFESTFRYFDRDETNTLSQSEMAAALASLGIMYSDDDMDYIYDQLVQNYGAVSFEAFINLLVDITEDQTSAEQLREAFQGIAANKVYSFIHIKEVWLLTTCCAAFRDGAGPADCASTCGRDRISARGYALYEQCTRGTRV